MSERIVVQARADHIASLSRATPLTALEELVWNALDAGATEVRIEAAANTLGAVVAVRVADNGSGIDIGDAAGNFGSLGGSWKRLKGAVSPLAGRRLHGRRGCGRFKAFALGEQVVWRTTVSEGGRLAAYSIAGGLSEPGVFTLSRLENPGPGTGTEVEISPAFANCDTLLDAAATVPALAARFALYLKNYPDVRIYFNGLPVTALVVQRDAAEYSVALGDGSRARLEIIEWRGRFHGCGHLVWAGPDGFALHEQPLAVRTGGRAYTAYFLSPRFAALADENTLVMDELNPEVRSCLDAAKRIVRAHFQALADTSLDDFRKQWKARIAAFSPAERAVLLDLLRKAACRA